MTEAPLQLTSAIAALWQGPPLNLEGSPRSPQFSNLVQACVEAFPQERTPLHWLSEQKAATII